MQGLTDVAASSTVYYTQTRHAQMFVSTCMDPHTDTKLLYTTLLQRRSSSLSRHLRQFPV